MSVTERHEDPGQFTIRLDKRAPLDTVRSLKEMGHIVILPQWHPTPAQYTEAVLLAAARYCGVVLAIEWGVEEVTLRGQGLVWHLGDSFGNGPILASDRTFTAATPTTVLALASAGGLIPPGLTVGTITNTGVSAYTGTFYGSQTCLEAIRTYMAATNMHFRINPDFSLDACLATRDEVFTVTTPTVVAIPWGFGADPTYTGLEPTALRSEVDATRWVSRSVVENVTGEGARSILSSSDRSPLPYKDPQGNDLVRNVIQSGPPSGDTGGLTTFHERTLAEWNTISEQEIDTGQYEFTGPFEVGDFINVYSPEAGFVDTTRQIAFRGQIINPQIIQVTEDEWQETEGEMGVYYRPSNAATTSADWIDLTRFRGTA